jgi:hypothetical protein
MVVVIVRAQPTHAFPDQLCAPLGLMWFNTMH